MLVRATALGLEASETESPVSTTTGRTLPHADPRHHLSADLDGWEASHALMSATERGGLSK
jgi:hypothetical protein